jgi:hypothetical protein
MQSAVRDSGSVVSQKIIEPLSHTALFFGKGRSKP